MRHIPAKTIIAIALLLGQFLGACGAPPTNTHPPASTPPLVEPDTSIDVVDALQRSVQLPAPPQRIVVAGKGALAIMDAMYLFPEAKERLVAAVIGQQPVAEFLRLVDPVFDQKSRLDVEAGPEQIAPLHPDVVVTKRYLSDTLGQPLEQLGIPVVYVDLETPEQFFRDLTTLGQLFGNPARAEEIKAFFQERLDRVTQALQEVPDAQKPRILLVQYSQQGGQVALFIPSSAWIQTIEVELAGGTPIWKEAATGGGWKVVNLEQIASWNPDQIFVIDYHSDSAQTVEQLTAEPAWKALAAVQADQVFGFAGDIFSWDQPDPRWILGLTWLAWRIYPSRFPAMDMTEEATEFYREMYHLDEASIAEHILPSLRGNLK
jgi:iron complex transport system substrate-binding protein